MEVSQSNRTFQWWLSVLDALKATFQFFEGELDAKYQRKRFIAITIVAEWLVSQSSLITEDEMEALVASKNPQKDVEDLIRLWLGDSLILAQFEYVADSIRFRKVSLNEIARVLPRLSDISPRILAGYIRQYVSYSGHLESLNTLVETSTFTHEELRKLLRSWLQSGCYEEKVKTTRVTSSSSTEAAFGKANETMTAGMISHSSNKAHLNNAASHRNSKYTK